MRVPRSLLHVFEKRGITDIESFLAPSTWSQVPHPLTIPGMKPVVDRIISAIVDKDSIAIHGDYVECVIMSSVTVHTRMNTARCAHSAPHNPDAEGNGIM